MSRFHVLEGDESALGRERMPMTSLDAPTSRQAAFNAANRHAGVIGCREAVLWVFSEEAPVGSDHERFVVKPHVWYSVE